MAQTVQRVVAVCPSAITPALEAEGLSPMALNLPISGAALVARFSLQITRRLTTAPLLQMEEDLGADLFGLAATRRLVRQTSQPTVPAILAATEDSLCSRTRPVQITLISSTTPTQP